MNHQNLYRSATAQTDSNAVVIIGCIEGRLPESDRAAATLGACRFGDSATVWSPDQDPIALRYALAAGMETALPSLDNEPVQVYLFGQGGLGDRGEPMAARLAIKHQATLVLDVLDFQVLENGVIEICRNLGQGSKEILILRGRVVLVLSEDAVQPMYVSFYRQRVAPLPAWSSSDSETSDSIVWEPLRIRTKVTDLASRTGGGAQDRMFDAFGLNQESSTDDQHLIVADPETCAGHLIRYLAHHQFIDRSTEPHELGTFDRPVSKPAPTASLTRSATATLNTRVPRPLIGSGENLHRWPRPYRLCLPGWQKLSRAPRPCAGPTRVSRGPFPL